MASKPLTRAAVSLTFGVLLAAGLSLSGAAVAAPQVITLTQVPCEFIEAENGVDHGFTSSKKAEAEVLTLKAGEYLFKVTNKNVPYELGFWLREADYDWRNPLDRLTKTSVSGGGLFIGQTQEYAITLTPGEYLYSCPLNTTPNYRLVVTE